MKSMCRVSASVRRQKGSPPPANGVAGKGETSFLEHAVASRGTWPIVLAKPRPARTQPTCSLPPVLAKPLGPTTALLGGAAALCSRERPWGHRRGGNWTCLRTPSQRECREGGTAPWPGPCGAPRGHQPPSLSQASHTSAGPRPARLRGRTLAPALRARENRRNSPGVLQTTVKS